MNLRKFAAAIMHVAELAATLTVLWQAVRFCKGEVGAPIVDQAIAIADRLYPAMPNGDPSPAVIVFGWIGHAYYYLFGIAAWFVVAVVVSRSAHAIARIVAVGFRPYCAEIREALRLAECRRTRGSRCD